MENILLHIGIYLYWMYAPIHMADVLVLHRLQRTNRSPGPGPQPAGRNSPGNPVTSMVSINFILPALLF